MKSMLEISPITEVGSSAEDGAGVATTSGLTGGAWKSVFWPESRSKNSVLVKKESESSMLKFSSLVESCGLMALRSRRNCDTLGPRRLLLKVDMLIRVADSSVYCRLQRRFSDAGLCPRRWWSYSRLEVKALDRVCDRDDGVVAHASGNAQGRVGVGNGRCRRAMVETMDVGWLWARFEVGDDGSTEAQMLAEEG